MKVLANKRWGHFLEEGSWRIQLQWNPQDLWIGVFWRTSKFSTSQRGVAWEIYICLIPCLPIYIIHWR